MLIEIPGIPVPLQRHRSFLKKGKIGQFDSQVKEKLIFQKKIVHLLAAANVDIPSLLSKEFHEVHLTFELPFPRSKIKKDMPPLDSIPHISKPDIDNLIKFVLDCGNGLLWVDDRKIVYLTAEKVYSKSPKTIIEIE